MNSTLRTIYLLLIVCFAVSCSGVRIDSFPIPPEVKKLEATNRKKINLETQSDDAFAPAGHQYLFVVIPFGRIEVLNPEASLYNKAATRLAVLGYNVSKEKSASTGTVQLSINNLQLTAYDLIFMRRIYCEIELTLKVLDRDNTVKFSSSRKTIKTGYKALAFKPQLEHIYTQCLDEAVNQALINIYS